MLDDPELQRETILQAAQSCFDEIGYDRTTLGDIAARSGLPLAAIAQCFPDKAEVMKGLRSLWSERLSAWIVYA